MPAPKDTFTIPAEATTVGVDKSGRLFCVLPSGSATVRVPEKETPEGADAGQAMINPQAGEFTQGYDSRAPEYDASLARTGDVTVTAGDVLVSTRAAAATGDVKDGLPASVTSLHVLSSATNAGGLIGAPVGWTGRNDTPRRFDLDAAMAQYVTPHIVDMSAAVDPLMDTAALLERCQKGMFLMAQIGSGAGNRGQALIPRGLTTASNYGGTIGLQKADVIRCIYDSRTPEAHRRGLFLSMIRDGIDIDDPYQAIGKIQGGNGGIHLQNQASVLAKRIVFGESLDGFMAGFPGNWAGAFIHTATTIAECTTSNTGEDSVEFPGSKKPDFARVRPVISATATTVTFDCADMTPSRLAVRNTLKVKRVSDGAEATVVDADPATGNEGIDRNAGAGSIVTLTLDATPAEGAFQAGDQFYFIPAFTLNIGDADWSVCSGDDLLTTNGWQAYRPNATPGAGVDQNSYINSQTSWGLQFWMAFKMAGGLPAEFEPVRQLIIAADAGRYAPFQVGNSDFWDAVKGDLSA